MNLSNKAKLLLFGLFSIVLVVSVAVTGYSGISTVDEAMDEIVLNSTALGNHLTADMMHDALRGDVLAALLAASQDQKDQQKGINAELEEHAGVFLDLLGENEKLPLNQEIKTALTNARPALNNYIQSSRDIVSLAFTDVEAANKQMTKFNEDFNALADAMGALSELVDKSTESSQEIGGEASALSESTMIIISIIAVIILTIVSMIIATRITRPLSAAVQTAERISTGDLTGNIEVTSSDETGMLLQALKSMNERLLEIVGGVNESVSEVSTASNEISRGNADLSQRTEEQASSLEETASSMEEMTSTVKQNADNASQANQLAAGARTQAEKGGEVVGNAITAMAEINSSSKKIADIISVIDEIAFQTNLLALNAAVEAARAGEQGRGFAVVAGEVRSLAGRSAEAAKEIKDLIQDSVEKVQQGTDLVDESGKTLEEIVNSVKKVTDIVSEIASSSQEQATGIEEVNKSIMQMDGMTQQNAALVEEAAAASESMSEQAGNLQQQISFFKVSGGGGGGSSITSHPVSTRQSGHKETSVRGVDNRGPDRPFTQSAEPETVNVSPARPAVLAKKTGTDDEWSEF